MEEQEQFDRKLGDYYNKLLDEKSKAEEVGDMEKAKEIQKKIDEIHSTFG